MMTSAIEFDFEDQPTRAPTEGCEIVEPALRLSYNIADHASDVAELQAFALQKADDAKS